MDFPKIKKEISQFLSSEEAKVLKKDIAKLGLTASVIASIIAQAQDTQAQGHTDSHSDESHGDHSDHSDGLYHTDSAHSDSHADAHTSHNDAAGAHSSYPIYDPARNRGGHNSTSAHANY